MQDLQDVPIGQLLLEKLRTNAGQVQVAAQIDTQDGRSLSYPQLLQLSVRAAAGWRAAGLRPGDYLGIYSWNRLELFPAILGAMYEGITVVLIVPFASEGELRRLLSVVPLKALLSETSLQHNAVSEAAPGTLHVVMGLAETTEAATSFESLLSKGDRLRLDPASYKAVSVPDTKEHVIVVTFSSGTSGMPKGVMMTNQNFGNLVLRDKSEVWGCLAGDRVLITHPLSWTTGLNMACIGMCNGATTLLANYSNEHDLLDVLVRHKASSWMAAPPRLLLLAQLVRDRRTRGAATDLSSLRYLVSTGGPMVAEGQRFIADNLGAPVLQLYGCTESGPISGCPVPKPGRAVNPTLGASGKVVPGNELRLVDVNTGKDVCGPGKTGEVLVLTPYMMKGYINNPEAQAQAVDARGFYRTGDIALLDENGEVHVVDRIKELLTFDEFDVAPAEIEELLTSHPAVQEACVVGRKHPRLDELPTAFVVLRPHASVGEQELKDLVKGRLADHKRLRGGVFFVDEIPKSTYGKMLRIKLRERLANLPPVEDQDLL